MTETTIDVTVVDSPDVDFRHLVYLQNYPGPNPYMTFCFEEGHNEACKGWLDECEQVTSEQAKAFVEKVQRHYDSSPDGKVNLNLVNSLDDL